jgi:hypothetical protein
VGFALYVSERWIVPFGTPHRADMQYLLQFRNGLLIA